MKKKTCNLPHPPERKELSNNPIKLCHEITHLSRAKARETNIDGVMSQPGARLVLSWLAINDGISQREVVDATHLQPPTVSVILRKMEEEGIVERRQNEKDKRQSKVYLTELGKKVDSESIAKIKDTDALAFKGLSVQEYETLMTLLGKMRQNLIDALYGQEKGETK